MLEVYGFYLRIRISGWAPVTNMYETVIWVALVAAVLSFVFELIYRQDLHGPGRLGRGACWARSRRSTCRSWIPSIKSLQPVLRSNFWLTIHVLTEVSSYAAFGLAWALGLIAMGYYLTATYRRSPRFCRAGAAADSRASAAGRRGGRAWPRRTAPSASQWATGDLLFYCLSRSWEALGGHGLARVVLAIGGEVVNRVLFRQRSFQQEAGDRSARESAERESTSTARPPCVLGRAAREAAGWPPCTRPTVAAIRSSEDTAGASSTPGGRPCRRRR